MNFIRIQGRRIEYDFARAAPGAPVIVFLHEGLGSLSQWRDFPSRILHATGCSALTFSRYGHGRSDPLTAPRRVDFMHDEALNALPELLDHLEVEQPVLLGHSEGASIALIYAGGAGRPVSGLIAMAPHVMVEDATVAGIRNAKTTFETTDLPEKLTRHHADPEATFRGWNDIWLDPGFRDWNIEGFLPRIACPILAIRGEGDEYGTMEQIDRIARLAADVELIRLQDCGHSPQRDQPKAVIEAIVRFVRRIHSSWPA